MEEPCNDRNDRLLRQSDVDLGWLRCPSCRHRHNLVGGGAHGRDRFPAVPLGAAERPVCSSPGIGRTALRRDERTQGITDKAAKNAFVVVMLAVLALILYYGRLAPAEVPAAALGLLIALGALT
ncbi:MAG: hypothetical protein MUO38_00465, partial [Anaerolineales bacterium]|nr:hypothetical protein [Anaerolineales bacterium]